MSLNNVRKTFDLAVDQVRQLHRLSRSGVEQLSRRAPQVSAWSIGQQLDHMLNSGARILVAITACLEHPEDNVRERPTWKGRVVLFLRWIPRGTGKAPGPSLPAAQTSSETREKAERLQEQLALLELRRAEIESCLGRYPQPGLGFFLAREHLLMLTIHTRHHLKIVRDIERQSH